MSDSAVLQQQLLWHAPWFWQLHTITTRRISRIHSECFPKLFMHISIYLPAKNMGPTSSYEGLFLQVNPFCRFAKPKGRIHMEQDENRRGPERENPPEDGNPPQAAGQAPENGGKEIPGAPAPDSAETPPESPPAPPDSAAEGDKPSAEPELPAQPVRKFHFLHPIDELYDRETTEESEKPEKGRGRGCLRALMYGVAVTAFSALLAIGILLAACDVFGVFKTDRKIDVEISNGATTAKIAAVLQKDGVIRFGPAFRAYAHVTKAKGFHPGTYTLNSSMGYGTIISTLLNSANNQQLAKVTIPEGKTLQQVGQILEASKVCSSQDFLTVVEAGGFNFPLASQIPSSSTRFYKYEGYLFPDTYEFYQNSSGKAAAQKMLTNFTAKFDSSMIQKASSLGFTVDQAVTLASIVQTESGKTTEMGKVASVFENRLKNGVKDNGGKRFLQSDATIFYVLRDIKPVLTQSDTVISSAYNTYKVEGLPPGPICNPGLDAIKAVLNPESTNYYYFVSDSSGKYYYAATYSEHQKNVKKAVKTGSAKGTNVYQ